MSQKLPDILIEHMRDIIESAPDSVRPMVTRTAALFLKREEPRWNRLSIDPRHLEERFYNFLNSPSTYDLLAEDLVPAIDVGRPLGGTANKSVAEGEGDWKETRCEPCKGLPDGKCTACGGKGWSWTNSKTGAKDLRYGNPVKYGRVNEDKTCPVCDGDGEVWNHPEPGEDVMLSRIECPHCHGTGVLKEDAPANAAGNAQVAGIGQPEGSAFGEPGFPLGGATTKTRKKNKRPEDLKEDEAPRVRYSPTNRRAVGPLEIEFQRIRTNGNFGELVTYYIAKTYVPTASGTAMFSVETKDKASVKDAYAELKDLLVNKYFVTGTLRVKRSSHDQVLNRELDKLNVRVEGFGNLDDLTETVYTWICNKCGKIWGPANDTAPICPRCGSTDTESIDDSELDEGNASDVIPKEMDPNRAKKLPSEHHYDGVAGFVEKDKLRIAKLTALIASEKDPITVKAATSSLTHAKQELATHEKELAKIGQEIERYRADKAAGIKRDGKSPMYEEREKFAGGDVFEVDMDRWMTSRFGKNRYHRYSRYVGNDKVGEEIRSHGRTTKQDIVLKDQTTGVMTYLRRKKQMG